MPVCKVVVNQELMSLHVPGIQYCSGRVLQGCTAPHSIDVKIQHAHRMRPNAAQVCTKAWYIRSLQASETVPCILDVGQQENQMSACQCRQKPCLPYVVFNEKAKRAMHYIWMQARDCRLYTDHQAMQAKSSSNGL